MRYFSFILLLIFFSCKKSLNEDKRIEVTHESKNDINVSKFDIDIFKLLDEKIENFKLEEIKISENVLEFHKNNNPLGYIESSNKNFLEKELKNQREAIFSRDVKKIYLREMSFNEEASIGFIIQKIKIGVENQIPVIKPPHAIFNIDNKLYIIFVKSEIEREFLEEFIVNIKNTDIDLNIFYGKEG